MLNFQRCVVTFVDGFGEERVQSVRLHLDEFDSDSWNATLAERFRFNVGHGDLAVTFRGRRAKAVPVRDETGVIVGLRGASPFLRT